MKKVLGTMVCGALVSAQQKLVWTEAASLEEAAL